MGWLRSEIDPPKKPSAHLGSGHESHCRIAANGTGRQRKALYAKKTKGVYDDAEDYTISTSKTKQTLINTI